MLLVRHDSAVALNAIPEGEAELFEWISVLEPDVTDVQILSVNMGIYILKQRRLDVSILLRDEAKSFKDAGNRDPFVLILGEKLVSVDHLKFLEGCLGKALANCGVSKVGVRAMTLSEKRLRLKLWLLSRVQLL